MDHNAYYIDGIEAPILTLTPGRTYRFTLSSSDMSNHPFRFYLEADKSTAYTTDVITAATYAQITVTDTTPTVLHYQCSAHGYMGNSIQTNSNTIVVSTASTFGGAIDANGNLDVDGTTELDVLNVAETATFSALVDINANLDVDGHTELDDVNVAGLSTFTGAADFNGAVDIDGHTELDDVNVSGASTFTGAADFNGDIDVDGHTELDNLNVAGFRHSLDLQHSQMMFKFLVLLPQHHLVVLVKSVLVLREPSLVLVLR